MPPQQVTTGSTPMEGIERMNAVVVRGQGQGQGVGGSPRQDSYVIEVNRRRNFYTCWRFRYMVYYCRNKGRGKVMEGRKVKYGEGKIEESHELSNNLKGEENLKLLD